MGRIGIGVACLLMVAACGKDVDGGDGFMTSAASAGTGTDTDASTTSGAGDDNSETSGDPVTTASPTTTMTTTMTTMPATTGPAGMCGNGTVDAGEQCDGIDLQGFDCSSLGLGTGNLSCDMVTCMFDTSMCMSTSTGTSG